MTSKTTGVAPSCLPWDEAEPFQTLPFPHSLAVGAYSEGNPFGSLPPVLYLRNSRFLNNARFFMAYFIKHFFLVIFMLAE